MYRAKQHRSGVELYRAENDANTRGRLRLAGEMGCDSAQGYYLSRPLPAGELTPWLTKQAVLPSTRLSRAAPA